jgi:uncharacterized repeat protein (TIGR03803 family)
MAGGSVTLARLTKRLNKLAFLIVMMGAASLSLSQSGSSVPSSTKESLLHTFCSQANCADGAAPYSPLITDSAGNLYGTTEFGGANGAGTVFMLKRSGSTWKETVLYSFCSLSGCSDGEEPTAGLTIDSKGNLYGTTVYGGTYCPQNQSLQCGVVFKLTRSKSAWTESVLHAFGGNSTFDGNFPVGNVVLDSAGNVYGATYEGGDSTTCLSFGCGILYELSSSEGGWTETILHYFALEGATDGIYPSSGLTADSKGNLYGETSSCITSCQGAVYKFVPGTSQETIVYSFTGGADGGKPYGGVILDSAGNLYGTTSAGGAHNLGTAFEVTQSGRERVLHSFAGAPDGRDPLSALTFDSSGNLYGTTLSGGNSTACPNGCGTFFSLNASHSWKASIYSFDGTDGSAPESGVLDLDGDFYGTASNSSATGSDGLVYRLVP